MSKILQSNGLGKTKPAVDPREQWRIEALNPDPGVRAAALRKLATVVAASSESAAGAIRRAEHLRSVQSRALAMLDISATRLEFGVCGAPNVLCTSEDTRRIWLLAWSLATLYTDLYQLEAQADGWTRLARAEQNRARSAHRALKRAMSRRPVAIRRHAVRKGRLARAPRRAVRRVVRVTSGTSAGSGDDPPEPPSLGDRHLSGGAP